MRNGRSRWTTASAVVAGLCAWCAPASAELRDLATLRDGSLACLDADASVAGIVTAARVGSRPGTVVAALAGGAPRALPGGGSCADAAVLGDGRAVVGWSRGDGFDSGATRRGPVQIAFADGAVLGAPLALTGAVEAGDPSLAVGPAGDVAAVWMERHGRTEHVVAGGLTSDGSRVDRVVLDRARDGLFLLAPPLVDAAADGTVVAAWLFANLDGRDRLRIAVRPPGGAFGAPRTVARGRDFNELDLDVAADATTAVTWRQFDDVHLASGPRPDRLVIGRAIRLAGDVAVAAEPGGSATVLGVRRGAAATIARRAPDGSIARTDLPVPGAVRPPPMVQLEGAAGEVTGLGIGSVLRAAADGTMTATFAVATSRDRASVVGVAASRDTAGAWSPSAAVTPPCCAATGIAPSVDAAGERSVVVALAEAGGARLVAAPIAVLPAFGSPLTSVTVTPRSVRRRAVSLQVACAGPCSVTASLPAVPGRSRSVRLLGGTGTVTLPMRAAPDGPPFELPRRLRLRVAVCDDEGRVRRFSFRVTRGRGA